MTWATFPAGTMVRYLFKTLASNFQPGGKVSMLPNFGSMSSLTCFPPIRLRERRCSRWCALSLKVRRALELRDGRRIPLAGDGVRLRGVEAHRQVERPLRRGQPVDLFVRSRALVLEVEVKRTVRVVFERHPATHRKAIEAVCYLKSVTVVERERPKGICRRCSALVEVDCVFVRAVER